MLYRLELELPAAWSGDTQQHHRRSVKLMAMCTKMALALGISAMVSRIPFGKALVKLGDSVSPKLKPYIKKFLESFTGKKSNSNKQHNDQNSSEKKAHQEENPQNKNDNSKDDSKETKEPNKKYFV